MAAVASPWVDSFAVGIMNIQNEREALSKTEPTNFTVVRLKRDVLHRSSIGVMATSRSLSASGTGSNQAYGVDGAFSFFENVSLGAYWARTATTGVDNDDQSYQGRFEYGADRYGARAEFLSVDRNFRPEVGFTRRTDIRRSFGELRFSPRPTRINNVRKLTYTGSGEYVINGAGQVDARVWLGHFGSEFENSDQLSIDVTQDYELLRQPFTPAGSPTSIAPGDYNFGNVAVGYAFGAQRRVSGTISVLAGDYYNGTIRSVTVGPGPLAPGRVSILKQLSIEPTLSVTRIVLPDASFTTRLARARIDYGFSPLMFVSGLLQYSSADRAVSTNLRFRWEYAPGSELFLVYTDERATPDDRFDTPTTIRGLKNRVFVVKANRLLRF
jgi:hypothetical protein